MDAAGRRERIIESLLSRRTALGTGVGIWAARPCQMCGRIDSFSGFVSAMAVHAGPYHDFVCSTCRSGPGPDAQRRTFDQGHRWAAGALAAQVYRICERCQVRLKPFEPHRHGSFWVCPSCAMAIDGDIEALRLLARRRYLDMECPTEDALSEFERALEAMGRNLDETLRDS